MATINTAGDPAAFTENVLKALQDGSIGNYPIPNPPSDLGTAMNQQDIDFVKTMRKIYNEQFTPPVAG